MTNVILNSVLSNTANTVKKKIVTVREIHEFPLQKTKKHSFYCKFFHPNDNTKYSLQKTANSAKIGHSERSEESIKNSTSF
jgi:hypothetical protein